MNDPQPRDRASPRRAAVALVAGLLLGAVPASANGRFPNAQDVVVGPGPRSDVIVLRTTFGLVMSRDAGATFHWMCEAQLYRPLSLSGEVDPAVSIAADGSVVFGFIQGINLSPDGCRIARDPVSLGRHIADLTANPAGDRLFAVESDLGMTNHVLRANASSLQFEQVGAGVAGVTFTNLDVAPSRPGRLYVSGFDPRTRSPRVFRSDDDGVTLVPLPSDLGAVEDAWLSGVDPTDPDVIYVRSYTGVASTVLLRSADAGAHFTRVASTTGAMLGFAISDDGGTVWMGSREDGLWRSDDRGRSFARVSDLPTLCLRQHAGVLWACSDWTRRPFVLGRSRDGGRTFEPALRWEDIDGAFTCDPSLMGPIVCGWQWPGIQDQLGRAADAGWIMPEPPPIVDAGGRTDAGDPMDVGGRTDAGDRMDASGRVDAGGRVDVGGRMDAGAPSPGNRGCTVGLPPTLHGPGAGLVLVLLARLRRRVRPTKNPPIPEGPSP